MQYSVGSSNFLSTVAMVSSSSRSHLVANCFRNVGVRNRNWRHRTTGSRDRRPAAVFAVRRARAVATWRRRCDVCRTRSKRPHLHTTSLPLRPVYSDTTQLNSTELISGLWMNVVTQLTQFVSRDVINKNTTDLAVRCSTGSVEFSWIELSCVAINTPLKILLRRKITEQRTTIQKYGDWYTGLWWVGCCIWIWYSEEGFGRAAAHIRYAALYW